MKKIILLLLLNFNFIIAQVIISPYIVYTDSQNRFGSFLVQNESNEAYEITISFVFGYPVSDSLGNMSMKYFEQTPDTLPSVVKWIKAFPRKFVLNPKERQTIRLTVRPNKQLEPGTYWARIVTSSTQKSIPVDTVKEGITAQLKFVLNQVTTLFYRVDSAFSGAVLDSVFTNEDSTGINIYAKLKRIGNSPFLGDLEITVRDSNDSTIVSKREYLPLYYNLVKKIKIPKSELGMGKYTVFLKPVSTEKQDIPQSKLKIIKPETKSIEIEVK